MKIKSIFILIAAVFCMLLTFSSCEDEKSECTHAYENTCSDKCLLCGEVRTDVGEHIYDSTSKCNNVTCTVCGYVREQRHTYNASTKCENLTCTVCGYLLEQTHTYNSSTKCDNLTCTVCSYVLEQEHNYEKIMHNEATLVSAESDVYKCTKCEKQNTVEIGAVIDPLTLDMPIVYITDLENTQIPLANLEKSNGEIAVKYEFVSNSDSIDSFECYSKIKIQGATSSAYPKKNFTIKLYKDENLESKKKVDFGWGNENKYCMKANYVDFSQARNIVAAELFAQVVQTRDNVNPGLAAAPNYGLIDGFPILVYLNGEFYGLYTMNIPKDSWQFAMEGEEEAKEALLMADIWSTSVVLEEQIGEFSSEPGNEASWETYGWELEHCSTADDTWVRDSFNSLISVLNYTDTAGIKAELPNHLDIEAAIDNMIFTYAINAADNVGKNILWATYDGEVWIPSMYDMDGTFGIYWNGQPIGTSHPESTQNTYPKINEDGSLSIPGIKLYTVLCTCFTDEVKARYSELRASVLNYENIRATFESFFAKSHELAYEADFEKWGSGENPTVPYLYAEETITGIYESTYEHLTKRLDPFFCNFEIT